MNKRIFLTVLFVCQLAKASDNYKPVVQIESPKYGSAFELGEEITFQGKATDIEDEKLLNDFFVWTSDVDGFIGKGDSFSVVLSKGYHIIMLTVTDSKGDKGEASIFISVGIPKIPEPVQEIEEPNEPKPEKPKPEIERPRLEEKKLPFLEFIFVPPFGSTEDLRGRLINADPNQFGVAVYVMKNAVWSSKPSVDNPVTKINADGTWICDITTFEEDEFAIKITAYLIPNGYQPPTADKNFSIIKEIEEKCLAKIEVTRKISGKIASKEPVLAGENAEASSYFPLAVGNTWKYQKTIYNDLEPLHYTNQIILEDDLHNTIKKGNVLYSVSRALGEIPETSIETYTIVSSYEFDKEKFWKVEIEGQFCRDGRYDSILAIEDPNVSWLLRDNAVWEAIDGRYLEASAVNKALIAVLKPGVTISSATKQGDTSFWAVGSALTGTTIATPAGKFEKCLKNCTIIKGENLRDILTKNASPKFSDSTDGFPMSDQDFGKFATISYFKEGIGLVMESQYDLNGRIVYDMSLVDYKVN